VVAKLHKDSAGAIAAYDKGHEHMLMVAAPRALAPRPALR
jgi:hypothetical protein